MIADPLTPSQGIRLAGGAPIPPAPVWGAHRPVTLNDGRYAGAVVEITPGRHVPVCSHADCRRGLPVRPTYTQGKAALRAHWTQEHAGRRAS